MWCARGTFQLGNSKSVNEETPKETNQKTNRNAVALIGAGK
jgi:hypothetical protein